MFTPDYQNIVNAALNRKSQRIPLYEHIINEGFIENFIGRRLGELRQGNASDMQEYFRHYTGFFKDLGYDTVSFEGWTGSAMPESGALGTPKDGVIKTREDFNNYPWDEVPDIFFNMYAKYYEALRDQMPQGMAGIGGIGNGVFECVQEVVGFEPLCLIKGDDEELYADLFTKVGDMLCAIWERFLPQYGDIFCVCRFGDDLGFRSATLLSPNDIREHIIPQYKRIIDIIHSYNKPFLLHSCGNIDAIMEDLISVAGINAKHSNEDAIAPFSYWIDTYGARIGNFGGLDTDVLCDVNDYDLVEYTTNVYNQCANKGHGVAIGSGNSIPEYVCEKRFVKALEVIRGLRGE